MTDKHFYDDKTGQWRHGNPVLYTHPTLPAHWIAEANDHQLYMFGTYPKGWDNRQPYHGHTEGLQRVAHETARAVVRLANAEFDMLEVRPWVVQD